MFYQIIRDFLSGARNFSASDRSLILDFNDGIDMRDEGFFLLQLKDAALRVGFGIALVLAKFAPFQQGITLQTATRHFPAVFFILPHEAAQR